MTVFDCVELSGLPVLRTRSRYTPLNTTFQPFISLHYLSTIIIRNFSRSKYLSAPVPSVSSEQLNFPPRQTTTSKDR